MSSGVVRAGALAGLLAAALLILSAILYQLSPLEGIVDTPMEYAQRAVTVLAYLSIIGAVLGIHAVHRGQNRYGRLGTTGAVLTIAGYAALALVTVISMIRDFEYLLTLRLAAAIVLLIGSALLGIVIIRAKVLPWWCGVLLIIAFPLGDVANALFPTAENLLLTLLWGSIGFALLSRSRAVAESRASQSTGAI